MPMKSFHDEGDVKKAIKDMLKRHGWWYFMPKANQFGTNGIPDFICLRNGIMLAIEAKFGRNTPSDLQDARMKEIRKNGGYAVWVNETRLEQLDRLLGALGAA